MVHSDWLGKSPALQKSRSSRSDLEQAERLRVSCSPSAARGQRSYVIVAWMTVSGQWENDSIPWSNRSKTQSKIFLHGLNLRSMNSLDKVNEPPGVDNKGAGVGRGF